MGGLYNVIFGKGSEADALLSCLGLTRGDCGRFRDAWVKDGEICVYTRNGGNNREDYMPDFSEHPNYLRDEDDDFDNTYATIYFSFPEKHKKQLSAIQDSPSGDERWATFFKGLNEVSQTKTDV